MTAANAPRRRSSRHVTRSSTPDARRHRAELPLGKQPESRRRRRVPVAAWRPRNERLPHVTRRLPHVFAATRNDAPRKNSSPRHAARWPRPRSRRSSPARRHGARNARRAEPCVRNDAAPKRRSRSRYAPHAATPDAGRTWLPTRASAARSAARPPSNVGPRRISHGTNSAPPSHAPRTRRRTGPAPPNRRRSSQRPALATRSATRSWPPVSPPRRHVPQDEPREVRTRVPRIRPPTCRRCLTTILQPRRTCTPASPLVPSPIRT